MIGDGSRSDGDALNAAFALTCGLHHHGDEICRQCIELASVDVLEVEGELAHAVIQVLFLRRPAVDKTQFTEVFPKSPSVFVSFVGVVEADDYEHCCVH